MPNTYACKGVSNPNVPIFPLRVCTLVLFIVVCKKYHLDVVIKELSLNKTYKEVHSDCVNIISRHLDYMVRNEIKVQEQHEQLPSFYWLPKLHKKPYGSRFIRHVNTQELRTCA